MSTETPADTIRRAAELMRKRAQDATPGPWARPLNVRNKAVVTAALPEGERGSYISGIDPDTGKRERCAVVLANTWSDGKHFRKRSGRDLEYIAAMHPLVALGVVDLLQNIADDLDDNDVTETVGAYGEIELRLGDIPAYRFDWVAALKLSRAFLGEA